MASRAISLFCAFLSGAMLGQRPWITGAAAPFSLRGIMAPMTIGLRLSTSRRGKAMPFALDHRAADFVGVHIQEGRHTYALTPEAIARLHHICSRGAVGSVAEHGRELLADLLRQWIGDGFSSGRAGDPLRVQVQRELAFAFHPIAESCWKRPEQLQHAHGRHMSMTDQTQFRAHRQEFDAGWFLLPSDAEGQEQADGDRDGPEGSCQSCSRPECRSFGH